MITKNIFIFLSANFLRNQQQVNSNPCKEVDYIVEHNWA